jgi:phosphatidyl-myo-inositol alpha-mannosyltransferase
VATFHAASTRSRFLAIFDSVVQAVLERLSGRIAVSPAARKLIVEHLGGDAVVIPNGVSIAHYAQAPALPGYPMFDSPTIGFIGRYDEPRKGMTVLLAAMQQLVRSRPGIRLLVAGRGEQQDFLDELPRSLQGAVVMLGMLSEADKASMLRSVDVYVAPNTGGESFGIILLEAMAAGTPIVASDLQAFRRVLEDRQRDLTAGTDESGEHDPSRPALAGNWEQVRAGLLFPTGDADALTAALGAVLDDERLRRQLAAAGSELVRTYDWSVVASQVLRVYEIAMAAAVPG